MCHKHNVTFRLSLDQTIFPNYMLKFREMTFFRSPTFLHCSTDNTGRHLKKNVHIPRKRARHSDIYFPAESEYLNHFFLAHTYLLKFHVKGLRNNQYDIFN